MRILQKNIILSSVDIIHHKMILENQIRINRIIRLNRIAALSCLELAKKLPAHELIFNIKLLRNEDYFEKIFMAANNCKYHIFMKFISYNNNILNLFYKHDKAYLYRRDISKYISSINGGKNYELYEIMDNDTLLYMIYACMNKFFMTDHDYYTCEILFRKITSGFSEIFKNITRHLNNKLLLIFSKLHNTQYKKILNEKNSSGYYSIDELHTRELIRNRFSFLGLMTYTFATEDDFYVMFTYMLYTGAISDSFDAKRFRMDTFAPQLATIMHEQLGYENNWKKLYNTDLIFNKIISYVV